MLRKPILKESKNNFNTFIKEKVEQAQLKKAEKLKKVLLNPNKSNQFKDLRKLKTKLHTVQLTKSSKKKKFDLNSDEENENFPTILKHKGQDLEMIDDFNEEIEGSSVDDELNKEYVNELHFGGFDNQGNESNEAHKKSKQEIYKEIIKKSKKMRYEKQKLREENINKVDEIDQDQATLNKILEMRLSKDERRAQQPRDEYDDYDKLTKELFLDGKTYANNISLKDPKKLKDEKKLKNKRNKKTERIFSDEEYSEDAEKDYENDDIQNDDELEENLHIEKRGIGFDFDKKQKKTEKLNAFINQLQEIKRKKLGNNDSNSSNSEEDLEPSEEDDDDSEDYEKAHEDPENSEDF